MKSWTHANKIQEAKNKHSDKLRISRKKEHTLYIMLRYSCCFFINMLPKKNCHEMVAPSSFNIHALVMCHNA